MTVYHSIVDNTCGKMRKSNGGPAFYCSDDILVDIIMAFITSLLESLL